ncbi:heavy-metal-associated domain-containing protein [Halobaculum sp. MBLA0143]|uniref:heavy-metal-associated domain-containing protein n=1 Tax=Halobaculum sp. MBLA0143 TaxID=3079933 RepID=UPI0035255623
MATELTVTGMSCTDCEASVVEALEALSGAESATADHETDTATVSGEVDPLDAIVAVEDAGYEADSA